MTNPFALNLLWLVYNFEVTQSAELCPLWWAYVLLECLIALSGGSNFWEFFFLAV